MLRFDGITRTAFDLDCPKGQISIVGWLSNSPTERSPFCSGTRHHRRPDTRWATRGVRPGVESRTCAGTRGASARPGSTPASDLGWSEGGPHHHEARATARPRRTPRAGHRLGDPLSRWHVESRVATRPRRALRVAGVDLVNTVHEMGSGPLSSLMTVRGGGRGLSTVSSLMTTPGCTITLRRPLRGCAG
jgi:hypothetical protein